MAEAMTIMSCRLGKCCNPTDTQVARTWPFLAFKTSRPKGSIKMMEDHQSGKPAFLFIFSNACLMWQLAFCCRYNSYSCPGNEGQLLYPTISKVNHSCAANATTIAAQEQGTLGSKVRARQMWIESKSTKSLGCWKSWKISVIIYQGTLNMLLYWHSDMDSFTIQQNLESGVQH